MSMENDFRNLQSGGNKRNTMRIFRILNLIYKIWKKNPDLRLCQLIGNCYIHDDDTYFIEDDDLEKRLKERYRC